MNNMSDTDSLSLSSDARRTVDEIKTILEGTTRRVEKGCIVKIHIDDLSSSVIAEQVKFLITSTEL